ncbi:MAG TPA: NAD(P)-dependent oxidoreductase [Phnomibacter sp.]|nr:NAD(P)-dependent oxidoreductase [Phnomibacter sp.]
MRTAFIIGCNGYLGRNVSEYLLADNWKVYGFDVAVTCYRKDIPYQQIDVSKSDCWNAITLQDADLIFFFSGITGTWKGFDEWEHYLTVNEKGLLFFLQAMRQSNATGRIIFPSTRLVYKGVQDTPLKEDAEKLPLTVYAVNKLSCENYLQAYSHVFNINFTVFRVCVPYGSLIDGEHSYGTIGFFETKARTGEAIVLYGDGSLKRTFTHVHDIARIMTNVSLKEESNKKTYNIGGDTFSLLGAASLVAEKFGVEIKFQQWPLEAEIIESGDTIFDSTAVEQLEPPHVKTLQGQY